MAVGDDRPRQFLVAEVFGDRYRKHTVLTPGVEVRGLGEIGTAGLDAVVGTDRDVEFLLPCCG